MLIATSHRFMSKSLFNFPLEYPNAHRSVAHHSVIRRKVANLKTEALDPDQEEGAQGEISLPGCFE